MRAARSELVWQAKRRAGTTTAVLFDAEFLAVADAQTRIRAVLAAACTQADACDLQLLDQHHALCIAARHGFDRGFLDFFATVEAIAATACAHALRAGAPVVVDDVAHDPIFTDRSSREAILDARTRAVTCYPLIRSGDGVAFGVLSLHHHRRRPGGGAALVLARGATLALEQLGPAPPVPSGQYYARGSSAALTAGAVDGTVGAMG